MNRSLRDYEVLSFDCYGTLIDWESGIWAALQPMLLANDATVSRPEVLAEFGRIEAALEAGNPTLRYADLLMVVHRDLAANLDLDSNEDMDVAFGASVPDWPEFADSAVALAFLSERYQLVILSNVGRTSFAGSNERLKVEFDAIYTAEDIGSYKPDPANFDYLLGHLEDDFDVMPDSVLHIAQSLYHDHAPAKAAGLDTAWIDRQRLSAGGEWGATTPIEDPPEPDHVFFSMADLARAIEEG
ncbi:MAG: HAD family hydrolase [Acidimicrobiia bacterium]